MPLGNFLNLSDLLFILFHKIRSVVKKFCYAPVVYLFQRCTGLLRDFHH